MEKLSGLYDGKPVNISEPAILINIPKTYRCGMNDEELYDATRGTWRVGLRRDKAEYAFAVFRGIVREVYKISGWFPAGTTSYRTIETNKLKVSGRWEFVGVKAEEPIRAKYRDKSVEKYFNGGSQQPIRYANC